MGRRPPETHGHQLDPLQMCTAAACPLYPSASNPLSPLPCSLARPRMALLSCCPLQTWDIPWDLSVPRQGQGQVDEFKGQPLELSLLPFPFKPFCPAVYPSLAGRQGHQKHHEVQPSRGRRNPCEPDRWTEVHDSHIRCTLSAEKAMLM